MHDTAGSAAAPAARCRNCRRGSFISILPSLVSYSITSSTRQVIFMCSCRLAAARGCRWSPAVEAHLFWGPPGGLLSDQTYALDEIAATMPQPHTAAKGRPFASAGAFFSISPEILEPIRRERRAPVDAKTPAGSRPFERTSWNRLARQGVLMVRIVRRRDRRKNPVSVLKA